MNRVIIFGGTGLFGKSILRYFEKFNHLLDDIELTLLSRNPDKLNLCLYSPSLKHKINILRGDILDNTSFPENNFDFIIHAATDSTNGLSLGCMDRSDQIVLGTRNVLEWTITNKASRLLYISSGGIYGGVDECSVPFEEGQPSILDLSNTEATYSTSKAFSEHLCFLYGKKFDLNFVVARCFTFFGEDLPLDRHFAIGNFLNDALNNRPILIKGDGTTIRSYMDQYDLAHWLIKILFEGCNGEIYNVGSDREISLYQLASLIDKCSGNDAGVIVKGEVVLGQSRHRNYYVPSTLKFQSRFGVNMFNELEETIKRVLQFNKYGN